MKNAKCPSGSQSRGEGGNSSDWSGVHGRNVVGIPIYTYAAPPAFLPRRLLGQRQLHAVMNISDTTTDNVSVKRTRRQSKFRRRAGGASALRQSRRAASAGSTGRGAGVI